MKYKLLWSIDDFGLYPFLDSEMIEWLDPQKISRVSVMMGLGEVYSLEGWTKNTGVSLDIHLHATVSEPILKTESRHTQFVNIPRRLLLVAKMLTGQVRVQEMQERWEHQIKAFVQLFHRPPDGINSHEHIHLFPPYFKIAVALALRYHIPYIRLGDSFSIRPFEYRTWALKSFHKKNSTILEQSELSTSAALYSYDWGSWSKAQITENLPEGTEIILHPSERRDYELLRRSFSEGKKRR